MHWQTVYMSGSALFATMIKKDSMNGHGVVDKLLAFYPRVPNSIPDSSSLSQEPFGSNLHVALAVDWNLKDSAKSSLFLSVTP